MDEEIIECCVSDDRERNAKKNKQTKKNKNSDTSTSSPPSPSPTSPYSPSDGTTLTNNEKLISDLIAGALAGAIAKTVIAPMDMTKIYFQTTPTSKYSTRDVFRYLHKRYKKTGFFSLWRGNSATMTRIIPYAAIQFSAHEQWKYILNVESSEKKSSSTTTSSAELTRFICGSLAGVTAQSLTYPLDLTRARLAVSSKSQYRNLIDVFVKTVKGEGIRGLFKGYVPTMLGVIPYAGCGFYCYELLKRLWTRKFGEGSVGGLERLCFGSIAGVLGQTSSYPFDIVRRRLQTRVIETGGQGGVRKAGGLKFFKVFGMMADIARNEGIVRGLYKGLSMNWIKGPIAAGLSFSCFDLAQAVVRKEIVRWKTK